MAARHGLLTSGSGMPHGGVGMVDIDAFVGLARNVMFFTGYQPQIPGRVL